VKCTILHKRFSGRKEKLHPSMNMSFRRYVLVRKLSNVGEGTSQTLRTIATSTDQAFYR
jgi:hypothetical protein